MIPKETKIRIPNLFIVGAPKCGTTSLSEYLRTHPDIFVTTPKELHYFCFDFNERFPRLQTKKGYLQHYQKAEGKKVLVDASPWYLYSTCAIEEALKFNPKSRFIAMVRNPIEMIPSLHRQLLNNYNENQLNLRTAWELQSRRKRGEAIPSTCREAKLLQYSDTCRLGQQIQKLFAIVPPQQRMVIVLDDLQSDARSVYQNVISFLDLKDDGRIDFPAVNKSFRWRYQKISDFLRMPPGYIHSTGKMVLKLLNRERIGLFRFLSRLNDHFNRQPYSKEKPSQQLRKEFSAVLDKDIALLSKLLKRDFSDWLN